MITDSLFWLVIIVSVPAYWLAPVRWRAPLLTVVSYGYLLTLDVPAVLALSLFTALFYLLAPRTSGPQRIRRITTVLVLGIIAYLAWFKYLPAVVAHFHHEPVLAHVVIPLGVSYFTFKLIHYAIERGRNKLPAHGFWDFACYLFLFPIFTAGPIERFEHFIGNRERHWRAGDAAEGAMRIAHGLVKKLVIANLLLLPLFGSVTDIHILLERLDELPVYKVWGFFILSFFYLYLDFSAYSDIAIGISRLYGITIVENFNWPILATDIGMFWKRWHMSLSGWCQGYVYMPLIGFTRNPYLASYASFMVMGLWHSGSLGWIMWGVWHATGTSAYVYWQQFKRRRKWRGLNRPGWRWLGLPMTLSYAAMGGVFTAAMATAGPYQALRVLARMAGL
ncbi:MAG: MBOAT family protein [Gammaproteobacteria bacterium]|nr:MBOAT family protein [Gammaproteobacteria bacterium]